jgi:hypothetical protein
MAYPKTGPNQVLVTFSPAIHLHEQFLIYSDQQIAVDLRIFAISLEI